MLVAFESKPYLPLGEPQHINSRAHLTLLPTPYPIQQFYFLSIRVDGQALWEYFDFGISENSIVKRTHN